MRYSPYLCVCVCVRVCGLTSTWQTVVMAVSRYIVICRPLHARGYISLSRICGYINLCHTRGYISLRRTRWSIVAAFVISAVVNVPRLLRFTVTARHCSQLGLLST